MNPEQRETPETDAAEMTVRNCHRLLYDDDKIVESSHARFLEHQLTVAREELAALREKYRMHHEEAERLAIQLTVAKGALEAVCPNEHTFNSGATKMVRQALKTLTPGKDDILREFIRCQECKETFEPPEDAQSWHKIKCPGCGKTTDRMWYIELYGTTKENACKLNLGKDGE